MNNDLIISTHIKLLQQGEFALLKDIQLLQSSTLFDADYYLDKYPSIREANMDPYLHYTLYGWRDNLEPSAHFSCAVYCKANPGIQGVMSPLIHYLRYGIHENRLLTDVNIPSNIALEIRRLNGLHNDNASSHSDRVVNIRDLMTREFRDFQPIPFCMLRSDMDIKPRLNFVTDALAKSLLGGVGTALILATQYAVKHNMDLRIITRHAPAAPSDYMNFMEMMHEKTPDTVSFYSDCDRDESGNKDFKLELSEQDIFFTTSWWTTVAVKNMNLNARIFYIIQEVEPFFYPYNDQHLFCTQQLNDDKICYIVNSHYLWDYFKANNPVIVKNGIFFEPAFPQFLYKTNQKSGNKKKLFFYSRKNHMRNLYYTGLQTLDAALLSKIIDPEEWDIYFAGSNDDICLEFSDGTRPVYLGQMTWQEYADFLSTVDLTFSLMYTPHPSYPPLDTIASGGVCVTNMFLNKKDNPWCKNLIFSELSQNELLETLKRGVALACDDKARSENYNNSTLPASWTETLADTLNFMEHFFNV